MDMDVDGARRRDQPLAIAHRGAGGHDEPRIDPVHDRRVAGLADADDLAVADAEIALHDAEHGIDDEDVAEQKIEGALGRGDAGRHADPVAQGLAAAMQAFVAVDGVILLHDGDEGGVGEAHAVPRGGTVEGGVVAAGDRHHDRLSLIPSGTDLDRWPGSVRSADARRRAVARARRR